MAPVYMQGWARRAALDASTSAAGALVEHGLTVPERFRDAKPWYSAYDGTYWGATTVTDQVARPMRPSSIRAIRSAKAKMRGSWVTTITARSGAFPEMPLPL